MRTRLITLLTRMLRWWFRPRSRDASAASIATPRAILILKPCCLGDVLLTTPLVAQLRASYPQAAITYALGPWARPMVSGSRHIDAILTLPERWTPGALLAVARSLRVRGFDAVFVPDRSPMLTLLAWLAGIPQRVGLDSAGRGFAYTHPLPVSSIVQHEADLYSALAPRAGLPQPPRRLWFFPSSADEAAAEVLVAWHRRPDRPLVVLHPGGGQNPGMTLPRKRWLPERWAAVADALVNQHEAQILLVGGPGDHEAIAAVAAAMRWAPVLLERRWIWGELGALLRRSDLFLGHDTGMMHLAMAVGTPTVAVFGPSDPQIYGPYGAHGTFVWRPTPESPCFYDGVVEADCACAMQCMRNVQIEAVLHAAERMLVLGRAEEA